MTFSKQTRHTVDNYHVKLIVSLYFFSNDVRYFCDIYLYVYLWPHYTSTHTHTHTDTQNGALCIVIREVSFFFIIIFIE